jgi:hypothetical protein
MSEFQDYRAAKHAFEREYISNSLLRFGGRINETAKHTRLSKVTLIDKIRVLDINVAEIKYMANAPSEQAVKEMVLASGDDQSLAQKARRFLFQDHLGRARDCRKNKEHEAERILLWMAVEALGDA